ncbi:hypothetical protein ACHAWC_007026 [Mediolabrus comicus]
MADDPSLKKLVKQQNSLLSELTKALGKHTNQVATLTTKVENGFALVADAIKDGTSAVGNLVAQLTAMNAHAVQYQASFTGMATDIAGINTYFAESSKNQKKKPSSHETDPMNLPINLSTSSGIKAWIAGTTLPASIPTGLLVKPDSRKEIRGLMNHLIASGYASILYAPDKTKGNGLPGANPLADGSANTNIAGGRNMMTNYVNINQEEILQWSAWIHGGIDDGLDIPATRVQKTVDVDDTGRNGNNGLVAQVKIDHRVRAGMLLQVMRKHIDSVSLEALLAQKDLFTWKREDNGTEFYCGLTIAWLIMEAIEPKTVIDAKEFEKHIFETSLIGDCNGDVSEYLSTLTIAKDQLEIRHPNRITPEKYFEAVLKEMQTIKQPHFKSHVDMESTRYLTGKLKDFDAFIKELLSIYTALTTAGTWSVDDPQDKKMIAMATKLKQLEADNKKLQGQSKSASKKGTGGGGKSKGDGPYLNPLLGDQEVAGPMGSTGWNVLLWRTKKTTQTITRDGVKWHWCNDPAHYDGKGLYMKENASNPGRHDHEKWVKKKQEMKAERDAKKAQKKKRKSGDDSSVDSSSSTKALNGKLTVKKPKKEAVNALVTQYNWDHHQALEFCAAHGMTTDGEESDEDF